MKRTVAILLAAVMLGSATQAQAESRLYLVSQYEWGEKLGFYLDLEGDKLAELPVILGVADGRNWRFASHRPGFAPRRPYRIRGVVTPEHARLFLDGELVAESAGAWRPAPCPLKVNDRPSWAAEIGDWLAVLDRASVRVLRDDREVGRLDFEFQEGNAPLRLFEGLQPVSVDLTTRPGDTVTVDVVLHFEAVELKRWAPIIDAYGQCRYADWPQKVRGDQDLSADVAREDAELAKMPPPADYDDYGGYLRAGWREEPSGFFRVVRRDGYWWLITPAGNPCFYLSVCGFPGLTWPATPVSEREHLFEWLPPRKEPWSGARGLNYWGTQDGTEYVCFYSANLIRKYGGHDWKERAAERGLRRLKAWGLSGIGKWGGHSGTVSVPVLHRWATPQLVRHPDIFDPEVREAFHLDLEGQIAPRRDDATVLGWSLGNEYDEIITPDEVKQMLAKPAETPAKRALLDYAVDELYDGSLRRLCSAWDIEAADRAALYATEPSPAGQDLEKLRCFYADRYYEFIYRTVKAIDPNHLYLGFWIVPGWWVNEADWRLIAPHCDVIGYDRYGRDYEDELLARLKAETDKPVFCGEFSFPPFYDGSRGFGRYGAVHARGDAEAGDLYSRWVQAAATDPYCVGVSWFTYHDQPLTGRGPGRGDKLVIGEHFAFGLVTETDRPKWELVRRMREANLGAAAWRLDASAANE